MKRMVAVYRYLLRIVALILVAIAVIGFGPPRVQAATNVAGAIAGNVTWNLAGSPYLMTSTVSITSGATLTIEPGVVVQVSPGSNRLWVQNGGTLIANGTAALPITFTSAAAAPAAGDWDYLWFDRAAAAQLSNCAIRYAGRGSQPAIYLDSSNVSITDCTIANNLQHGLNLRTAGQTPTLTNVTISNNGGEAIHQETIDMTPKYTNLTLSGNGTDAVVFPGGTLNRNVALDGSAAAIKGVPYRSLSSINVTSGTTLTLTAGTTLQFAPGSNRLWVQNGGTLMANGTSGTPILFTSSSATPAAGDWDYLWFDTSSTAQLSNCTIRYAGRGNQPAIFLDSSNVSITDCTIANNAQHGVILRTAGQTPALRNVTLSNNGGEAIHQDTIDMNPVYQNLTITGNGTDAVVFPGGTLNRNVTLDGSAAAIKGVPYRSLSSINVTSGTTLTLTAGTTLQFAPGSNRLWVQNGGSLQANGTAPNPITFTSSLSSPAPGDWDYLWFDSTARASMTSCVVQYAGRGPQPAIYIDSSSVSLTKCRVANNLGVGIALRGAGIIPVIDGVTVANNGGAAITQNTADMAPRYNNLTLIGNADNSVVVAGFNLAFLTLGSSVTGTVKDGQTTYYRLDGVGNKDIVVTATAQITNLLAVDLYYGATPGSAKRLASARNPLALQQLVVGPAQTGGTYYLVLRGLKAAGAGTEYTAGARNLGFEVIDATPAQAGNIGESTFTLFGSQFPAKPEITISGPGGSRIATAVLSTTVNQLEVTIDLSGLPVGSYSMSIAGAAGSVPIAVVPGTPPRVAASLNVPSLVRAGRQTAINITYSNPGNRNIRLPFITLTSPPGGELRYLSDSVSGSPELLFLAPPVVPGLPWLPPGSQGSITFYYTAPITPTDATVRLYGNTVDDPAFAAKSLNWDTISASLRPAGSSDAGWNAYIAEQRAIYGETYGSLFNFLAAQIRASAEAGVGTGVYVDGQWLYRVTADPYATLTVRENPYDTISLDDVFTTTAATAVQIQAEPRQPQTLRLPSQTPPGDGVKNSYVIIVGNPTGDLPGATRDAQNVQKVVKNTYNIPDKNVQVLIGSADGTTANVKNALNKAISQADADDEILFWNSSHGSLKIGTREYQAHYSDGTLLSSDFNTIFGQTTTPVIMVADTCHSAGLNRQLTNRNVVTIAGCQWNQTAADGGATAEGLQPGGMFSNMMLKEVLADPGGNWIHAYDRAAPQVYDQRLAPVLKSKNLDAAAADRWRKGAQALNQELEKLDPAHLPAGFSKATLLDALKTAVPGISDAEANEIYRAFVGGQNPDINARGNTDVRFGQPDPKKPASKDIKDKQKEDEDDENQVRDQQQIRVRSSFDPNEKTSLRGFGVSGGIKGDAVIPYTVYFENDPQKATLPAQVVVITDRLSSNLDWGTFELKELSFGSHTIPVPPGLTSYVTEVDLRLEGIDLVVRIEASLDPLTGQVIVRYTSLDPITLLLTEDPAAGFLPPNDAAHRGEGHVSFTIKPLPALAEGTRITNRAEIGFDINPPIITNEVLNTIGKLQTTFMPLAYRVGS